MSVALCGVCNAEPKKYKCPTCSIPYCSIACFKLHKPNHEGSSASALAVAKPTAPEIPRPPTPPPKPAYIKEKVDFTSLSSNTKFQELLKSDPTLLPSLQRVYAATIEPDPEDAQHNDRGGFRGRYRGRGRGRGRGGRGGGGHPYSAPKWTQKRGDQDAMKLLKRFRDGKHGDKEMESMAQFVQLVEDTVGDHNEN